MSIEQAQAIVATYRPQGYDVKAIQQRSGKVAVYFIGYGSVESVQGFNKVIESGRVRTYGK